jgi:hypothetical protein
MKKFLNFVWLFITITRGVHIKHTWNNKSPLILAAIGENVSSHIYGLPIFAANPITQVVLDAANLRVRNAYNNRKANPQELIDSTEALITILDKISAFADPICNGSVAVIESAGFEATASSTSPAVNPGRGNTPVAIPSPGGIVDFSAKKIAGVSHIIWVIFMNGVFDIAIAEGHIVLPPGNPGCTIIPEGGLHETLSGFPPRSVGNVGNIPVNSAGCGQMSVIVEFSTL